MFDQLEASEGIKAVSAMPRSEEWSQSRQRHPKPAKRIAIPKSAFKRLDAAQWIGESTSVHREL